MASSIDPTKPSDGVPAVKADLRQNLEHAKSEIEALQSGAGLEAGAVAVGNLAAEIPVRLLGYDSSGMAALYQAGTDIEFSNNQISSTATVAGGSYTRSDPGATSRSLKQLAADQGFNPREYGANADGVEHPVSEWLTGGAQDRGFPNLGAIQADYPHVTALTDSTDWAALQKCCDLARNSTNGMVYVPAGHYRINQMLDLTIGDGRFESINFVGAGASHETEFTVIQSNMTDRPALSLGGCLGGVVRDLSLVGPSTANVGDPSDDPNDYVNNGTVLGQFNACTGIVVDAFEGNGVPEQGFPGAGALPFPSSRWGKFISMNVTIANVYIFGFAIGIGLHCHTTNGAQGDNVTIFQPMINNCAYGISVGNDQARGVNVFGGRVRLCYAAISTRAHGNMTGICKSFGVDVVGCYRALDIQASQDSIAHFNLDMEGCSQILRYGNGFVVDRTPLLISGGRWRINSAAQFKDPWLAEAHGIVRFEGFYFDLAPNASPIVNVVGSAPYVTFSGCMFRAPAVDDGSFFVGCNPDWGRPRIQLENCSFAAFNNDPQLGGDTFIHTSPVEPRMNALPSRIMTTQAAGTIADPTGTYAAEYPLGDHVAAAISSPSVGASTVTFTAGDPDLFQVGDIVMWQTWQDLNFRFEVPMLRVTGKAGAGITCAMLFTANRYDGSFAPGFVKIVPVWFSSGETCLGDVSNGSPIVSVTTGNADAVFRAGDWLDHTAHAGLPAGLRVVSVDSAAQITVNKLITSTASGVRLGGPVRFRSLTGAVLGT